jgi:hypothetical protein
MREGIKYFSDNNPLQYIYRFEYYTSNDLSRKYPESLSKSSTKDLVGCIDYDAGLLLADKALLSLWVRTYSLHNIPI